MSDSPPKRLALHLVRAAVVAAMHLTWLKSHEGATEFWRYVRDEDHPDVDHPSRRLAKFLSDSIVSEREHRGAKKYSPLSFQKKCLHAWNAYRTGTRSELRIYDTDKLPKIV